MPTDPKTFRDLASGSSQYDALDFFLRQSLAKMRVATLVQVLAVTNNGSITQPGTVDVQPLVQQVDGEGNVTALPPIYGVPYVRVFGGTNAVILDPQVGDVGVAIFADRDLSAVKVTMKQAGPGSNRRNSLADALYLGGVLNGVPQQYVAFTSSGIIAVSPTKITMQAPAIELNGAVTADSTMHVKGAQTNDSTITASGDVIGQGTSLHTHLTTGVTPGSGNSGLPT